MTAENAIKWLRIKKYNRWRLFRGDVKVDEYDPDKSEESSEEALENLEMMLPMLKPSSYKLKGWNGKNKQAAQSEFAFEVTTTQNSGTDMNTMQLEELVSRLRKEIGEQMHWESRVKALEMNYERLATEFKKVTDEVVRINEDLTDDDKDNDGDAFERITELAEKLPGIAKGLGSLASLGKTN